MPKISHCHFAIARIAKEICAATYEELMSCDNILFAEYKRQTPGMTDKVRQRRFVARNWSKFIEGARATLALQLKSPIDEKVKDEIMEILVLDATLIRGRAQPAEVLGEIKQQN